jgi:hypothetical protein
MVESFKRYYHNSFLDSQRQEACNLFLGNYIHAEGQPMLWELQTDYYLHHADPRFWLSNPRRNYINWYTPEFLNDRSLPPLKSTHKKHMELIRKGATGQDDYWMEYYRPLAVTSFLKVYAFRLNCPPVKEKDTSYPSRLEDASPFVVRRKQQEHGIGAKDMKKPARKGVTILEPSSDTESRRASIARRHQGMRLHIPDTNPPVTQSILRDPHFETHMPPSGTTAFQSMTNSSSTALSANFRPANKALMHQWSLTQFYENSLNPSITATEQEEYEHYIQHPLNLPLVVSNEAPVTADPTAMQFFEYLDMSDTGVQPAQPAQADDESDYETFYYSVPGLPRIDTDVASVRSLPLQLQRPSSSASFSYPLTPFSHPHSSQYQHKAFAHNFQALERDRRYETEVPDYEDTAAPANEKWKTPEEDIEEFEEFLKVKNNPLDVEEADGAKKRYKAYRQWLRGKSFFKQSKVDPEWEGQLPVR